MRETDLEYLGARIGLDGIEQFLEGNHEEVEDEEFQTLFLEASDAVDRLMQYLNEQGIQDYYC